MENYFIRHQLPYPDTYFFPAIYGNYSIVKTKCQDNSKNTH